MSLADASNSSIASLTAREAYLAMYYFVQAYWERGGKQDGKVVLLCSAMTPFRDQPDPASVATSDPAFWDDWLAAVAKAKEEGMPEERSW